jgi:D-alanyl-D-alanine carboxypeptidase/D-alanyl-D-alanine-endopeptidase (penicillin-binding protein 4)
MQVRRIVGILGAVVAALAFPVAALAQPGARQALAGALRAGLQATGGASGVYVVDLATGKTLFSAAANTKRMPASVEKLYTTSTALLRFGPAGTLSTEVLGSGNLDSAGVWHGTLYLYGGGDPTFGSAGFDNSNYGAGATVQRLATNLANAIGITAVKGMIAADGSYFDSLRGTPPTGYQASSDVEGLLSAVAFNRGWDASGAFQPRPVLYAARQFASALSAAGINVPGSTPVRAALAPPGTRVLSSVPSPPISTLIQLTNTPSDNYFAEMLLKGLGAAFGGSGTTAAGATVVRAQMARTFAIRPRLEDGSGLSRRDRTSPKQVVSLLRQLSTNTSFVNSLAVAGETGTLQNEMNGTLAQGRCRGKTGTLHDVANLVGYCSARNGHTLAFAFLMNSVDPSYGHLIEAQMAVALAQYNG